MVTPSAAPAPVPSLCAVAKMRRAIWHAPEVAREPAAHLPLDLAPLLRALPDGGFYQRFENRDYVGQRARISGMDQRWYVVDKDPAANVVHVGEGVDQALVLRVEASELLRELAQCPDSDAQRFQAPGPPGTHARQGAAERRRSAG